MGLQNDVDLSINNVGYFVLECCCEFPVCSGKYKTWYYSSSGGCESIYG
jgi:hypothetical protein